MANNFQGKLVEELRDLLLQSVDGFAEILNLAKELKVHLTGNLRRMFRFPDDKFLEESHGLCNEFKKVMASTFHEGMSPNDLINFNSPALTKAYDQWNQRLNSAGTDNQLDQGDGFWSVSSSLNEENIPGQILKVRNFLLRGAEIVEELLSTAVEINGVLTMLGHPKILEDDSVNEAELKCAEFKHLLNTSFQSGFNQNELAKFEESLYLFLANISSLIGQF